MKEKNITRPMDSQKELQNIDTSARALSKLNFTKARENIDEFYKNINSSVNHPLDEKEEKLMIDRKLLISPTSEGNFRRKLTQCLFENPKTGQLFNIFLNQNVPSLLELSLFKIKAMRRDGLVNDEQVSGLPYELVEKVNTLTLYKKTF